MNLGELVAETVDYINDSTVTAALIRPGLRDAVRWVERNYTLLYMETEITVILPVTPDGQIPPLVHLGDNVKSILPEEDGRVYKPAEPRGQRLFRQVSRSDFKGYDTREWPYGFYLVGADQIRPVTLISEEFIALLAVAMYSYQDWPVDAAGDGHTHWLIDHASDFLKFRACEYAGPALRDVEFAAASKILADEALKTLLNADQELRDGARLEQVGYAQDDLDSL